MPTMTSHSSVILLAALGVLSSAAAAVDTSEWKCESCPYPKGVSGTVEAGVGIVSDASNRYGDYTGLQRKGAYALLGGTLRQRGDDGGFVDVTAADLGVDARSVDARGGREGLYALRLGYREVPRHLADTAATPFSGVGSGTLTLPAGYPAGSTALMPLASTLQPLDLGFKYQRFDLGGTMLAGDRWSYSVDLRRDVRDGTRATSGSFFANATQLPAPLDQTTDQLEAAARYTTHDLQASLAYEVSLFRNREPSLTWDSPFTPVVAGATRGQLALAPDNQFHQLSATAGYDITPTVRASAQLAVGRATQDEAFVPATLNGTLPTALPASSLDGVVDTFNGSVRVTAALTPTLKLQASYARDVRENRTEVRSYTLIDTDMFAAGTRSNTPFTFKRDRLKLGGDYRGPGSWRFNAAIEEDDVERNYTEAVKTRETTVWGRAAVRPLDNLSLSLKLLHGERNHSTYGTAIWFGLPENPLLRKFNLADRQRNSAALRAEFNPTEAITLGASIDYANDRYGESVVGLTAARDVAYGADVSAVLTERTQASAYAQTELMRSRMSGSALGAAADWRASDKDRVTVLGFSIRHAAIVDKLDVGVEATASRTRSDTLVQTTISDPAFPTAAMALTSGRLFATYKVDPKLSITGSLAHETYRSQDWRLDGVQPATVANLLAFGTQPSNYEITVLRVALRYRF